MIKNRLLLYIDQDGGTFIIPCGEYEAAKIETAGDLAQMEVRLGLETGKLTNNSYMRAYELPPETLSGLRIPRGNEDGASDLWRPGGDTNVGRPEAVINTIPTAGLKTLDF